MTIDDDLAVRLERGRTERHETFKEYLNEVIRAGLGVVQAVAAPQKKQVRTPPLAVGRRLVENMDNIAEVLAIAEGEDHR